MRRPIIVRGCVWQVREHCRRHRSLQRMLRSRMRDRRGMKKVPDGPLARTDPAISNR